MKQEKKDKPITVKMFFHGENSKAERVAATEKMMDRCHPAVIGKEVIFLDRFEILKD